MVKGPKYSRKEVMAIRDVFIKHDLDHNGEVTPKELEEALCEHKNLDSHDAFQALDLNHDGVIKFDEYLRRSYPFATAEELKLMHHWAFPKKMNKAAVKSCRVLTPEDEEELRDLYNLYDKNSNGVLEPSEFWSLVENSGYNKDDFTDLFKTSDKDQNGVISFDEFVDLLRDAYIF